MKTAGKFSIMPFRALICIVAAVILTGCGSKSKDEKWVSREVVVSAVDAMAFTPVEGATVILENISAPENPIEKLVLHGKIGSEGKASLYSTFKAFDNDNHETGFELTGDVTISAAGYKTLAGSISSLTGEETRLTDNKSPIHVVVYMTKQ